MPKRLPRARTLKGDPPLGYHDSGGGVAGEPPIVLAHGATLRSDDWENIFPRLATRYRVIAYDARGHGRSGRATDYGLRALAADLIRMLRAVAAAPAVVIGHSIGGAAALVAAGQEPELVRGLVLEDPWLERYRDGWRAEYFRALRAALDSASDRSALERALSRIALPEPGPRGERTLGEVRGFYAVERIAGYYAAVDPDFVALLDRPDPDGAAAISEALPQVRCPTLILAADPAGSALAEGEAERLAAKLPEARVTRFPRIGHRIHGLRPEQFLEACEPFLRALRTAAPASASPTA
jgi:pimeloyl-ACP methyl ester carboxylesterase